MRGLHPPVHREVPLSQTKRKRRSHKIDNRFRKTESIVNPRSYKTAFLSRALAEVVGRAVSKQVGRLHIFFFLPSPSPPLDSSTVPYASARPSRHASL